MARRSRTDLALAWGVGMIVVGAVIVVASIASGLNGSWWDGEAVVPRDGETHRVRLDDPGGAYAIWSDRSLRDPTCVLEDDAGRPISLVEVPRAERAYVDTVAVAEPEASFLFTAPASGGVVATCDTVDATPVQTLDLAPAPNHLLVALHNWGWALLGVTIFLLGLGMGLVALASMAVAGIRRRSLRPHP